VKDRRIRILIFLVLILVGILLHTFSTYFWNSDLLKSIGIELFAAGLIAILLTLVLQDEVFEEIKNELKAPVKIIGQGDELSYFYIRRFKSANERIDIISQAFAIAFDLVHDSLEQKICEDNCKIRILLLSEDSHAFRFRLMDEYQGSPDRIENYLAKSKEYLNSSIDKFKKFEDEFIKKRRNKFNFRGSLRVKQYNRIPYFGYFRIDNQIFVTPYFSFGLAHESPLLEIRNESLFDLYEKHFEAIWTRHESTSVIDIGKF